MQVTGGEGIDLIIQSRSKSSENKPLDQKKTVRSIDRVNLPSKTRWVPKNDRLRLYWTGKIIIPMPAETI
jgi:hypothetical protein